MRPSPFLYTLGSSLYVNLTPACVGLSLLQSRGPSFAVPPSSGYSPLSEPAPLPELAAALSSRLAQPPPPREVCFAGTGDPLQALPALLELRPLIPPPVPVRVHTNGLLPAPASVAFALSRAAVSAVTVNLNSADPARYERLMFPGGPPPFPNPHGRALAFARACVGEGLAVTLTAVKRPGVDLEAFRDLAGEIGADVKERSWHP
ncbi:hypothetical protein TeGR_g364 [Tetraparma gracilis]|uniref:Radical SAM core domain-containing protein n=1 Tax=Tetraparma gracilis TaxID=2962635 RepID=A0ABQ6ME80_9STRA|nr:hypothetical protein TeGR_g364 [Tetraparma gracilis]